MATIIRMTATIYERLRAHHLRHDTCAERLSYLFGTSFTQPGGDTVILVADPPVLLNDDCYFRQSSGHVSLHEEVRDGVMIRFAASCHNVLVDVHDHWFAKADTRFSSIDDADDRVRAVYLADTLEPWLFRNPAVGHARSLSTVSIVLDQTGCDARCVRADGTFETISRIDLIGLKPRLVLPNSAARESSRDDPSQARHAEFIRADTLAILAQLRIGVVGCGGLGSIAAEGFYRLGARRFALIDDDFLDAANLNRWQGGRVRDIGKNKARLLARLLKGFGSDPLDVDVVPHSVLEPAAEVGMRGCDIVIGCVDNDVARHFLNRFAVQYLTPLFDAGVNIRTRDGVDFESRYYSVIPGATACLECTSYDLVDHARLSADLMDEVTAKARRDAGYVEDRPEIRSAPSAYALNLSAVSALMTEFTNWLCSFRPVATCSYRGWRDNREQRSDRSNHPEVPNPSCAVCGALLGAGPGASLPRPMLSGEVQTLLLEA